MSSWHSQENDSISDINMTPFVDVLLVLLVIFMVTAPIINQAIQVELPKDGYKDDQTRELDPLRVVINSDEEKLLELQKQRENRGNMVEHEGSEYRKKKALVRRAKEKSKTGIKVTAKESIKSMMDGSKMHLKQKLKIVAVAGISTRP